MIIVKMDFIVKYGMEELTTSYQESALVLKKPFLLAYNKMLLKNYPLPLHIHPDYDKDHVIGHIKNLNLLSNTVEVCIKDEKSLKEELDENHILNTFMHDLSENKETNCALYLSCNGEHTIIDYYIKQELEKTKHSITLLNISEITSGYIDKKQANMMEDKIYERGRKHE